MWSGDLTTQEYHILDPNKADRSITINFIHLSLCLDSQSQENLRNIKTVLEIPVRVEDFHFSLSCYTDIQVNMLNIHDRILTVSYSNAISLATTRRQV